jgi:dTDP-4-amino-4,6-dideoxygalactose transaminase
MQVPFLDLKAQYQTIQSEIEDVVLAVLRSQQFILGTKVEECEGALAAYCNCSDAVGVSSGTDALLACLMAEGIGPGDEVITTTYTFFATGGAISRLGATPVFVDICPTSYNLDVSEIEARLTSRTKAIIPVHLFGQCADMDPILDIAQRRGLTVIEDAAQAIGADYKGRRAGSLGQYGCLSFFPSKNLGCAGDGGMIVTQDAGRAERLRILRSHGSKPKYHHKCVGGNFRLDALQAAIVTTKLGHLDDWTSARQRNAERYHRLFQAAGLSDPAVLQLPAVTPGCRHVYNQFVIRTARRDDLMASLKEHGVGTEVYYPVPMHLQKCFAYLGYRPGSFPASEAAARQTLALPIYPELPDDQAQYVVDCVARRLVPRS